MRVSVVNFYVAIRGAFQEGNYQLLVLKIFTLISIEVFVFKALRNVNEKRLRTHYMLGSRLERRIIALPLATAHDAHLYLANDLYFNRLINKQSKRGGLSTKFYKHDALIILNMKITLKTLGGQQLPIEFDPEMTVSSRPVSDPA